MRHWFREKCNLQDNESHSFATEIRFKWKWGEYKTWWRWNCEVKETVATKETMSEVPLGKVTLTGLIL